MKKIYAALSVDEEILLKETEDTGVESFSEAVNQEFGWLHDSGISVDAWVTDDPGKLLTPEQLFPIHERVEKASRNELIYNTLVNLCTQEGLDTKIASRLMQDENFMSDSLDMIHAAMQEYLNSVSARLFGMVKGEYQDIAYRDADSLTSRLSQDKESSSPFHATLKLPPEQLAVFNDVVTMNANQLYEKYGPFGDDFDFTVDFSDGLYAYIKLHLPAEDSFKDQVSMYLCCNGVPVGGYQTYDDLNTFEGTFQLKHKDGQTFTLDIMQDEQQRRIGNTFIFYANTTDPEITQYNGKRCTILSQIGKEDNDVLCSGILYKAYFEDGGTVHVFDAELSERVFFKEQAKSLDDLVDEARLTAPNEKHPSHAGPEKTL